MHVKFKVFITIIYSFLFYVLLQRNISIYGDEPEIAGFSIKIINSYRALFTGDFSIFEPLSYLYGSIYTYLLAIFGFIISRLLIVELNTDQYYALFRSINLFLSFLGIFLFSRLLNNFGLKKNYLVLFLLISNPAYLSRSLFINQDLLAVFLLLLSFFLLSLYVKENNRAFYFVLYLFVSGMVISSKVTYAFPIASSFLYLIITNKSKIKSLLAMLFIPPIGYVLTFPHSIINFQEYFNRLLEMRTLEAGISLDSYEPNLFFYIIRIFIFFAPIIIVGLFNYKNLLINLREVKENRTYVLLFIFFISELIFFSFQDRKTDRWGIFLYISFLLLYLPMLKGIKFLRFVTFINILLLITLSFQTLSFFMSKDPRIELREFIRSSSDRFLIITDHGNMVGIDDLDNAYILRHRVYEKKDDIENYFPDKEYFGEFDYVVVSNGAIRDFNSRNNIKKFSSISIWNELISCANPSENFGTKDVKYEPQIGFTVYKSSNLISCINTTGP